MTETLHIGCGRKKKPGEVGLDKVQYLEVDVLWDLEKTCRGIALPFEDNVFDKIIADQVLEHIGGDLIVLMNEFHRILKDTGEFYIAVPNAKFPAQQYLHPDHKRAFTIESFSFWMKPAGDEDPHFMYPRGFWHMIECKDDEANVYIRMRPIKEEKS